MLFISEHFLQLFRISRKNEILQGHVPTNTENMETPVPWQASVGLLYFADKIALLVVDTGWRSCWGMGTACLHMWGKAIIKYCAQV